MYILYSLAAIVVGVGLVARSGDMVRIFGQLELAEQYLGSAGTYTAWKLIGIVLILGGFWVLVKG